MRTEVFATAGAAARGAAERICDLATAALRTQDRFGIAVSGGRSPGLMLEALAASGLPWSRIDVFQVDERIAPAGSEARNLTGLIANLASRVPLPAANLHPMPVEEADPLAAAIDYQRDLVSTLGRPPVLDLVHLGLGADGHVASLVPGDPVLAVTDREVAVSGVYQGTRRLTLTYPAINRAGHIVYLVTGADKQDAVARLQAGDTSIPAGRVRQDNAILILDEAALPR
jgi:6-phosphogluconolactonase